MRVVELHLTTAEDPTLRLCDGKKFYDPNIQPGSLVRLCAKCQRKVFLSGRQG